MSWMTTNKKMKTPNIWFWRPCWVLSPLKKEKPIRREQPTVRIALEYMYEGVRQYCWATRMPTAVSCVVKDAAKA